MVVDLYEHLSKPNINPKARIFRLYGDVVQLSNTLEISPLNGSGAILIVTRRIEIGPKCQIIINYKKFFRIIIYAAEITSGFEIIANNVSYKIEINNSKNVGKLLTVYDGKSPEYEDIHTFDNIILKNDSFFKILRYSLNIAITLFYDDPRITRSILSWIVRITRESEREETRDLYYHALTIFTKLNTTDEKKKNNIQFVPLLDMHIYKERIGEYMKFVKRYEEECKQILNDEQKIEMLSASLMDRSDSAKMYKDLNEGRKLRYESACELMKKIESELHEKRKYAESAFHGFKDGIKNWLDQQKYEAQKKLVIAIIELSLGIGKIVVQPGGVFSFVETIKKVADSFQEALDGVDLEKILEIAADSDVKEKLDQVNDLNDHVDKIKQIKNELENDFNSANNLNSNLMKEHGIIESLDIDALAKNLENIDQKGILLSTQWELTRRQLMKLLEFPVKQNIEGAETYLNSLENFFIFIDTYIKAKVQETESSEEFLRTSLQAEMSKRKRERVETLIKKYESKDHDEIKLQLIERLINIKFWMMLYLENYLCAFEYWSLSKSEIKLSVIKTFQELEDDIIKIRDELERAYKQFGCVPDLNWSLIKFDEKKYIEEFKNNQSVIIEIPLNCEELSNYAHINLYAFRVYLEGVGLENNIISLYISNTGILANKDKKNKEHYFISEPIPTKEFKYRVNSSINPSVDFDKPEKYIDRDNKYKNDENLYFVPTPFSQWKISLRTKIDLSGLKSINIHLVTYCHLII